MKKILFILIILLYCSSFGQENTRFIVVSDMHHYSPADNFKETIFFEIVQAAISEQIDFIFFTGDLIITPLSENIPIDSLFKDWRYVLETLGSNGIKVYACRGNNDVSREAWDSLFTGDYTFPANGPEDEKNITYTLEYNNILFIALDQYINPHRINQEWLNGILKSSTRQHIFVAGHEPAFKLLQSNCMGAYPEKRNIFWERLIAAGVKIYFCGHDHFYDHTIIDNGDGNTHNDVHQVIAGTAGQLHSDAAYDGDNGRWTPVRLFHEKENGYVLVDVQGGEVKLTWKKRIEANVFADGGDSYTFLSSRSEERNVPATFILSQNYPNPFNPVTTINYQLPKISELELSIYNLNGQKVTTLVSKKQPAGQHQVQWDASGFASGIYYYMIKAGEFRQVKKMILLQ